MSIEAMKQALEALDHEANRGNDNAYQCERDALRAAIEQSEEQEPVAWFHEEKYKTHFTTNPSEDMIGKYWQPLYTAPLTVSMQEPVGEVLNERGEVDYISYIPPVGTPLYTAQRQRVTFPTMLRKMWSGREVQAWLDENVNKEKNT